MLIKSNRQDGLLYVPLTPETNDGVVSMVVTSGVTLYPGWNEISDEAFNNIASSIEDKLDAGDLEIHGERKKGEDDKFTYTGKPLRDVHAVSARKIVDGCFNVALLNEWRKDVKLSSEIRHAIDLQLEKIDREGKKE